MSQLIFELSQSGRRCVVLPENDTPTFELSNEYLGSSPLAIPEVAEIDLVRHYTNLSRKAQGVDNVFYPLGSCIDFSFLSSNSALILARNLMFC